MSQLPLSNIITISVSAANPGVGNYNTSNLALFTDDAPASGWSGATAGYGVYLTPTQVGLDFGTSSKTFAMANAVFSQQPNILGGGGQLIIIPLITSIETLSFSGIAASGSFVINYNGHATTAIPFGTSAAGIQTLLQALPGLSEVVVSGSIASQLLTINMYGVYGAAAGLTITANSLQTYNSIAVTVTPAITTIGETIGAAITRTAGLVQYFGIMVNESVGTGQIIPQADVLAAAAVVLPLNKILFFVTNSQTDLVATTGLVALISLGSFTNTRMLYYGDTSASGVLNALVMEASYASVGLSVNFSGNNTTITMHLKVLAGVNPDPSMTQTILNLAVAAGADTYVSLQGVPSVFTSGANLFYDRVYNLEWFVGALQVAGFNYLAQTGTKIPQTEDGMTGLKGAYRNVCEQAVTNAYSAPGSWNSGVTFGNQTNFIQNISQRGYYIFSSPVAQQSQANRVARQAPLVQIALKEAGAIQSSAVVVNVQP